MLTKDRIKAMGITARLAFCLTSAVIGSAFQFGYNTGVINAPADYIRAFINSTNIDRTGEPMNENTLEIVWSSTVAIFAVGGGIGGFFNGFFADHFGRKNALLMNNFLAIIAALLMGLSKVCGSYEMIIAGRFFIGLNAGFNSGLCPMYITEIAPVGIRGSIGTLFQLGAVSSIFMSQIFGLPQIFASADLWPLLLGFTGIFAIFQLATLPFCPESPRYLLISKGKREEATKELKSLRNSDDVEQELEDMQNEADLQNSLEKFNFFDLFTSRSLLVPIVIAIFLHLSQQLSGINAVFYYSTDILTASGVENAQYATPFVGLILVFTTIISIPLMEVKGRRFLHLLGLSGMFFCSIIMTIATVLQSKYDWIKYMNVAGMMVYIFFFAIGPGSIPWMIVGEFFTQAPRPSAIGIAVLVNWTANFIIGLSFPSLFKYGTKDWTFIVFVFLLLFFVIFTYFFMPETKGKTSEEMAVYFQSNIFAVRNGKKVNNVEEIKVNYDEKQSYGSTVKDKKEDDTTDF